jgi:hypothetical protein
MKRYGAGTIGMLFLCSFPSVCGAIKIRLYSDPACSTFNSERNRSDIALGDHQIRSIKVESGAWYAIVAEETRSRRLPEAESSAYTAEDGCVGFSREVLGIVDAQWLSYDACDASCRSDTCVNATASDDMYVAQAYLYRQRDSGHIATRDECYEELESLRVSTGIGLPADIGNCACECLSLHFAVPPTEVNRERIRQLQNNCVEGVRGRRAPRSNLHFDAAGGNN